MGIIRRRGELDNSAHILLKICWIMQCYGCWAEIILLLLSPHVVGFVTLPSIVFFYVIYCVLLRNQSKWVRKNSFRNFRDNFIEDSWETVGTIWVTLHRLNALWFITIGLLLVLWKVYIRLIKEGSHNSVKLIPCYAPSDVARTQCSTFIGKVIL